MEPGIAKEVELRNRALRIFGLPEGFREAELTAVYRRQARLVHPDRARGGRRDERVMVLLNQARAFLSTRTNPGKAIPLTALEDDTLVSSLIGRVTPIALTVDTRDAYRRFYHRHFGDGLEPGPSRRDRELRRYRFGGI